MDIDQNRTKEGHDCSVSLRRLECILAPIVSLGRIHSAIELGCTSSLWMTTLRNLGVIDLVCFGEDQIDQLFNTNNRLNKDLSFLGFESGRKFDLLLCVNVSKHIDQNGRDELISIISQHSDTVLFSSDASARWSSEASCKFHQDWNNEFRNIGYDAWDVIRPILQDKKDIEERHKFNMFLYARHSRIDYQQCFWLPRKSVTLPKHLGGQLQGNVDEALMKYLIPLLGDVGSFVDIGCGNGNAAVVYAERMGLDYLGIDGDWLRLPTTNGFLLHDFSQGPPDLNEAAFDIGYSVEFLEHVEEKFQENYMSVFRRCNFAVVTAAAPGQAGRHHVNCRTSEYWIRVFADHGFEYMEEITKEARRRSRNYSDSGKLKPSRQQYFKKTGLVFRNTNLG